MHKQAVLLAAAARTVEVAELKRDLEQAQGELDLTKRQLEENMGKLFSFLCILRIGRIGGSNN